MYLRTLETIVFLLWLPFESWVLFELARSNWCRFGEHCLLPVPVIDVTHTHTHTHKNTDTIGQTDSPGLVEAT